MFDICTWIGCDRCAGDADCACLAAYRRKYGDAFNAAARGDLDVWFPRATPVATSAEKTKAADILPALWASHARLADGGLERIEAAEELQAARRRGRTPVWVKRGGV
jgi:hypothetical protein